MSVLSSRRFCCAFFPVGSLFSAVSSSRARKFQLRWFYRQPVSPSSVRCVTRSSIPSVRENFETVLGRFLGGLEFVDTNKINQNAVIYANNSKSRTNIDTEVCTSKKTKQQNASHIFPVYESTEAREGLEWSLRRNCLTAIQEIQENLLMTKQNQNMTIEWQYIDEPNIVQWSQISDLTALFCLVRLISRTLWFQIDFAVFSSFCSVSVGTRHQIFPSHLIF